MSDQACVKCGKEPEPVVDFFSAMRASRVDGLCLGCKILEFQARLLLLDAEISDK